MDRTHTRISEWLPPRHLPTLLAEREGIARQYWANVTYTRGDQHYGTDRGYVSFLDGYLHFAGERSEWAIRNSGRQLSTPVLSNGVLISLGERRMVSIQLPFGEEIDRSWTLALTDWQNDTATSGEEVLPPATVSPFHLQQSIRVCAALAILPTPVWMLFGRGLADAFLLSLPITVFMSFLMLYSSLLLRTKRSYPSTPHHRSNHVAGR